MGVNHSSLYSEIQAGQSGVGFNALVLNRQGGNVGIGTASQFNSERLSVLNTSAGATTVGLNLINNSSSANTAITIDFTPNPNVPLARITGLRTDAGGSSALVFGVSAGADPTERTRIDASGNLTMAATNSSGGNTGLCWDNSGSSIWGGCTSLLAYKENVANLPFGLDTVLQLRPVVFDWKSSGMHDLGFIAEEVEAVNPLLAEYTGPGGTLSGVKYNTMSVLLVKGVQELDVRTEFFAATTSLAELITATSTPAGELASTTPWVASFATASQLIKDALQALGDTVVHAVRGALYATTGVFNSLITQTITANVVNADTVNTKELCIEDVCITKAELERLLAEDRSTGESGSGSPQETPPPADEPPADEPPADTPPADDPPADEPPADEPPADTPPQP